MLGMSLMNSLSIGVSCNQRPAFPAFAEGLQDKPIVENRRRSGFPAVCWTVSAPAGRRVLACQCRPLGTSFAVASIAYGNISSLAAALRCGAASVNRTADSSMSRRTHICCGGSNMQAATC